MTWEHGDGRAPFVNGSQIHPGERHVIWRRVGGHAIFRKPCLGRPQICWKSALSRN